MHTIGLAEAKSSFAEIICNVSEGEEYLISDGDHAVAMVVPVHSGGAVRNSGSARGQIVIADDFNSPLDDFAGYR